MNVFNIERSFRFKKEKKWDRIYVVVDAHGTLVRPYHDSVEIYPDAVEVLKWMTKRDDVYLILWTSSYGNEYADIYNYCVKNGIIFDSINCNPCEKNNGKACFDQKFYFNVLIDDKSGFEPETDWSLVKKELQRIGEWSQD